MFSIIRVHRSSAAIVLAVVLSTTLAVPAFAGKGGNGGGGSGGGGGGRPKPKPTASPTPTSDPSPTSSPSPTSTPSPTPTPVPNPDEVDLSITISDSPDPYSADADHHDDGVAQGITYRIEVTNESTTAVATDAGVTLAWSNLVWPWGVVAQGSCERVLETGANCPIGDLGPRSTAVLEVVLEADICDAEYILGGFAIGALRGSVAHSQADPVASNDSEEETTLWSAEFFFCTA